MADDGTTPPDPAAANGTGPPDPAHTGAPGPAPGSVPGASPLRIAVLPNLIGGAFLIVTALIALIPFFVERSDGDPHPSTAAVAASTAPDTTSPPPDPETSGGSSPDSGAGASEGAPGTSPSTAVEDGDGTDAAPAPVSPARTAVSSASPATPEVWVSYRDDGRDLVMGSGFDPSVYSKVKIAFDGDPSYDCSTDVDSSGGFHVQVSACFATGVPSAGEHLFVAHGLSKIGNYTDANPTGTYTAG